MRPQHALLAATLSVILTGAPIAVRAQQPVIGLITKTETNWFTDEELRKISTMEKVTIGGAALAALYPIAWSIFFRGHPLVAHWFRTIWLFAIALLLFIPITSPGPASLESNLFVNALLQR